MVIDASPGPMVNTKPLLAGVGSVAPGLVGEIAAEIASYRFGAGIFAVEETTGGEVVRLAFHPELLIRSKDLIRVVLGITEAPEYLIRRIVSQHLQTISSFSKGVGPASFRREDKAPVRP